MLKICECQFCGYRWVARIENPRRCPSCIKSHWEKQVETSEGKPEVPV